MNRLILDKGHSFRRKIIVLILLVLVAPFLFISIYSYRQSVEGISNANALFWSEYMIQTARNLDEQLEKLNDQINDVIGNRHLQELLREETKDSQEERAFISAMSELTYQKKNEMGVYRIRVYPIHAAAYPEYMKMIRYEEDDSVRRGFEEISRTGDPRWQLMWPGHTSSVYPVPMISRIKQFTGLNDNKPRGMIVADLEASSFQRMISPPKNLQGQQSVLVDESGIVLSDSRPERLGKPYPSAALLDLIGTNSHGTATMSIDNARTLVSYVHLKDQPWTLVSTIPLDTLIGPLEKIGHLTAFLLGIYFICGVGIVIYITLYFTNPIVRLVRSMRKLEKGSFLLPSMDSRRRDEIGWLYQGFDQMVKRIQGLVEEVYQSEKLKKELEFQVLSHQINPHFLYNTLESIRWKAEQYRMRDISEMVASLGNLLRLSLNEGRELTTVAREIEQARAYVDIERARLDKPFQVKFMMEEEILGKAMLRLLLQPLMENAIHHGIRDNPERGKIIVLGRKVGADLQFELHDNGKGIPADVLPQLLSPVPHAETGKRRGVGLRNIHQRLQLYYGDDYGLQIDSGLGQGTKITIRHPILPE
ncbi:sensor histidine kinase [Cohnella herbarum]|uniref:histidine kinase n=1 Tax=Cohnella herbarum TaxID=2728023 RepID=A0A7Z2ZNV0_9BACL|nr:sensor histidine kinase [Cohnella herbarum]QJD86464.1 sensor histidine kinase [Cohnella herbarum]